MGRKLSPAGSTSEDGLEGRLILRPTIAKTFLKGVIGIAVFSVFLQLNWANLVHYLIFLGISLGLLLAFVLLKRSSTFQLGDESLVVKRLFRAANSISYQDVLDISVAQGMLARRFHCGTVFLLLKSGRGGARAMGGGVAELLEDVPHPDRVYELIASRLSPYSPFVEP